jgi:hypothetical protein
VPAPTANDLKTQVKTLLTPTIGTSGTKKVKLFDYLALAFKPAEGEDPAILRSPLDDAVVVGGAAFKRVNCLMISEAGFTQAKVPQKEDSTRLITTPRGRNIITRTLYLTYFYQFGAASENVFSANVEVVRTTLNDAPKLGFAVGGSPPGAGEWVEGHDLLQLPNNAMYVDFFGTTALHVAEGSLTIRLIEALG